jgi:hypothetical protein
LENREGSKDTKEEKDQPQEGAKGKTVLFFDSLWPQLLPVFLRVPRAFVVFCLFRPSSVTSASSVVHFEILSALTVSAIILSGG